MILMPPGMYPVSIRLCLRSVDWVQYTAEIGHPAEHPQDDGSVTTFEMEDGSCSIVICFSGDFRKRNLENQLGLVVHEVQHVWQVICDHIREEDPSDELEAYSVQWIFQWLYSELTKKNWIKRPSRRG